MITEIILNYKNKSLGAYGPSLVSINQFLQILINCDKIEH